MVCSVSNYFPGDKNIDIKSHLRGIKTFHEIGNVDVTMGTLQRYNRSERGKCCNHDSRLTYHCLTNVILPYNFRLNEDDYALLKLPSRFFDNKS